MKHLALLLLLALAACLEPGEGASPPRDPPPVVDAPPVVTPPVEPPPPPAEPEPPPCLGVICQGACCEGGLCDSSGACAVMPPPPPPEDPQPVAHVNVFDGLLVTYYSWQPLDSHDPWSAAQLAAAWGAGAGETYGVCGYSRCFCRVRAGTVTALTVCYDTATVVGGDPDIGMAGYAIVTIAPGCIAADENCPTPDNPARVPWH